MLFGFDFYDGQDNDRLRISVCCAADGYLDIEELFVERHRRQGIGTHLIDGILELAEKEKAASPDVGASWGLEGTGTFCPRTRFS